MIKNLNNIIVFTDGSCINNGKKNAKGGIGVYFPCKEFDNVSEAFIQSPITNQRAELYSIYKALTIITENSEFKKIIIYSDSLYSIKCMTEWIKKWEKNDWKGSNKKSVLNQDLIRPINDILTRYENKIVFRHVKAHTGNDTIEAIFNDVVDKLACEGTLKNV